ncbi:MAG: lamin tail domain-containing protein [Nocardioides sp.]|nr:lamin tail domain-containing protein [Nocardioides sp.]
MPQIRRAAAGTATAALATVSLALIAPAAHAAAAAAPAVDLSSYSLVGRYSLPEPSNTPPPDSTSLLDQEASSVTYDWDTGSLFVVGDGGTSVVQVSKTGQLIDSMTLAPGDSPQGTTFYDTEAITYVGSGQFVLGEERDRQVNLFTYAAGTTLTRADVQTVKLGTTIGNTGIEGITYDPQTSTEGNPGFIAVKEIDPKGIFQTNIDFAAGTATNGSPTTDESTNLFDPADVPTDDFSDIYALSNQPSLAGTDAGGDLLILSQQSGRIVDVDRAGNVLSSMDVVDSGAPLSVPDETHEGITMDRDGNIYTVNENGGGDASHPQLWVYSPTTAPRVAVTEVAPWGSSSSYGADWFELTNTGTTDLDLTGWTMDDSSNAAASSVALHGLTTLPAGKSGIFFEDDPGNQATSDAAILSGFSNAWFGSTTPPDGLLVGYYGGSGVGLSTGGDAVNLFDAGGSRVTGVSFGAATGNVTFDNSARLGSTAGPVAVSTLAEEGVNKAFTAPDGELGSPDGLPPTTTTPPGTTSVVVSEVAPWASGNTSYAADWFELTNTGSTAVDLTGWKMDDSSASDATAVPLTGVTTLPAGASAVFLEDTGGVDSTIDTAFAQAWFSLNAFPAGDVVGHYGGSGVGLSTGGDSVAIFNGNGDLVTGVSFGASPSTAPFASFDNSAGIGADTLPLPTISTLSVDNTNGAFTAADDQEVGSPFVFTPPTPSVVVSEVAPWASGNTSYAADWFELTNTGATDVDLTGWKMDDNSDSAGVAVALHGVSTLPAGRSAVFIEDTDATAGDAALESAFAQAWFGTSTLPAGFLVGFYGGSGVGLSTGGDHVNIFDGSGNRVSGVAFGASPSAAPFASFDNTAGEGSTTTPLPTISTPSVVGTNLAFPSADGIEIGSPGNLADTAPPVIEAHATPAPNAGGWNNSPVTVSYTCTDVGLGVDSGASDLADDVLTTSGTATGTCVDLAGNSASASYDAKIDTTAPTAGAITIAGPSGSIDSTSVSFTFSSTDTDVVAFRCRLDGVDTALGDCTSGYSTSGLDPASYTLEVRAVDRADNLSAPATRDFTVVPKSFTATPRPTITGRAKVGSTLVAHAGTWVPVDGGIHFAYQWFADGQQISGATTSELALGPALAGHRITVAVTASQDGYASATEISAPTTKVAKGKPGS